MTTASKSKTIFIATNVVFVIAILGVVGASGSIFV